MNETQTITELARDFGVTTRAIRYWESHGLVSPERAGGNRVYSKRDRTRLKLALRGKDQKLSAGDNTLNPGRYDLKVTFPDGVQYSKSVEISAGGRLTVSCSSGLQTCSELR